MIGVTFVTGEGWVEAGKWAAGRMEQMTGVPCAVVNCKMAEGSDFVHPAWSRWESLKDIPDWTEALVFDADIVCLKRWRPDVIFESCGRRLCGVPIVNEAAVYQECLRYSLPTHNWYLCAGLVMLGREHLEFCAEIGKLWPKFGRWEDQTAFNFLIKQMGIEVVRLPQMFNRMAHGRPWQRLIDGTVNLHLDSLNGDAQKLLQLQREIIAHQDT